MSKVIDMTGWKMWEHGVPDSRIVVLEREGNNQHGNAMWKCVCNNDGNQFLACGVAIRHGKVKSCGCLKFESHKNQYKKHGEAHKTKLYSIWCGMKRRCYGKGEDHKCYKEKNIKVCDEWRDDYLSFKEWALTHGYKDGLTIDRINGNRDYSPENCRWVDMVTQANNKDCVKKYEYNGEAHSIAEWSRIVGIYKGTIMYRMKNLGWDFEKAITTPLMRKR